MNRGLILAAPTSGSGKTTVTLGLLRALSRRGVKVRGAKSGPDYIDPRFHESACGMSCVNLDAWAMTPDRIAALAAGDGLLVVEGAMGLFDGAPPNGKGATADLARILDLPVVLVVDASKMAQSVAPVVRGFALQDNRVNVAGIILNRVGSPRHESMLRAALSSVDIPVVGVLYRDDALALPSRHLGLVQALEHSDLGAFLDLAANRVEANLDLDAIQRLARPIRHSDHQAAPVFQGKRHIAVAKDAAFAFCYPHHLADWQAAGATITYFSPLADDHVPEADLVYLPGGYPELHAARLADCRTFLKSIKMASQVSDIYGECGGYMVLGESLTDADGAMHKMAGLLALQTSFAERRLHLGYRNLRASASVLGGSFAGHEFHYATTLKADGSPLFDAWDAEGNALPPMGLIEGRVCGSFAHIIDKS